MPGENIIMLQTVASGLGDLVDEMVFVGGAVFRPKGMTITKFAKKT